MLRDSGVPEHLAVKSIMIIGPSCSTENNDTAVRLKCRPFGRSNKWWVADRTPREGPYKLRWGRRAAPLISARGGASH